MMENKVKNNLPSITLSLSKDYKRRFSEFCKRNYTDMSKQLRKWIDQVNPPNKEG